MRVNLGSFNGTKVFVRDLKNDAIGSQSADDLGIYLAGHGIGGSMLITPDMGLTELAKAFGSHRERDKMKKFNEDRFEDKNKGVKEFTNKKGDHIVKIGGVGVGGHFTAFFKDKDEADAFADFLDAFPSIFNMAANNEAEQLGSQDFGGVVADLLSVEDLVDLGSVRKDTMGGPDGNGMADNRVEEIAKNVSAKNDKDGDVVAVSGFGVSGAVVIDYESEVVAGMLVDKLQDAEGQDAFDAIF